MLEISTKVEKQEISVVFFQTSTAEILRYFILYCSHKIIVLSCRYTTGLSSALHAPINAASSFLLLFHWPTVPISCTDWAAFARRFRRHCLKYGPAVGRPQALNMTYSAQQMLTRRKHGVILIYIYIYIYIYPLLRNTTLHLTLILAPYRPSFDLLEFSRVGLGSGKPN